MGEHGWMAWGVAQTRALFCSGLFLCDDANALMVCACAGRKAGMGDTPNALHSR